MSETKAKLTIEIEEKLDGSIDVAAKLSRPLTKNGRAVSDMDLMAVKVFEFVRAQIGRRPENQKN